MKEILDKLYDETGMSVERYGTGYLIADYSGHRGEASYSGISLSWRRVAVVHDPFPTQEAAAEAARNASLGPKL